ncbi:hypothetical protein MFIFM68171_03057 [Madurella fahalii]|uniref:Zn(2)-C6 fungal-type domain-containing protein n=1 Tax=Madurella fahalii TaxID=1157608 RepID=A0ABQ0G4Z8_9PEZI
MSLRAEQQFVPSVESESTTPAQTPPCPPPPPAPQPTANTASEKRTAPNPSNGTDSTGHKRQRISRSCDQCHGRSVRCQGYKPCGNCTKKGRICTYDRPNRRGLVKTPPPPPDSPLARNLSQRWNEKGKEHRDKGWAARSCDRCRSEKLPCKGKLPCDSCFNNRVECTYKLRASQRSGLPQASNDAPDGEGVSEEMSYRALAEAGLARAAPDIAPLQLSARHAHEETPPLVFLHKAWRRIAEALDRSTQTPGRSAQPPERHIAPPEGSPRALERHPQPAVQQSKSDQPILAAGDQPFDCSQPLRFPDSLERWVEMQESFQKGWTEIFHFLHRLTARSWLETAYRNMTSRAPLERDIGHAKATIAVMTMALGALFYVRRWNPSRKEQERAWIWTLNTSDQLFLATLRLTDQEPGPPSMESVQARLLQALYLLCTCRLNQAWYVFGNVVHMMTGLGLHRRRGRNRGLGPEIVLHAEYAKVQCERRTFWSAYVLDRQIALMSGRPCYLNNDAIDQDMPDCVNDEDMGRVGPFRPHQGDCYMEALVEQIKLTKLIDTTVHEVYSLRETPEEERLAHAWVLGKHLENWKTNLPFLMSSIKISLLHPTFRRQAVLLQLAHWHAQMLVYRPFMTAPYPSDPEKRRVADLSIRACIEAARATLQCTINLAREQVDRDKSQFHTMLGAHHITFCAASILFLVPLVRERQDRFAGPHYKKPMRDGKLLELAEKGMKALAEATNKHSPARRWAVILEEMRDEAARQVHNNEGSDQGGEQARDSDLESPGEQLLEDALRAHWEADLSRAAAPNNNSEPPESRPVLPPKLWGKWMTTDWLDLDAAAFGPISSFKFGDLPIAPRQP